jgi:hypothetical protein
MEENEEETQPTPIDPSPGVRPVVFLVTVAMLVAALVAEPYLVSMTKPKQSDACVASEALQKVQLANQKEQLEANNQQQQRAYALQFKVAQLCADKGGTPQFSGFNVTCQK